MNQITRNKIDLLVKSIVEETPEAERSGRGTYILRTPPFYSVETNTSSPNSSGLPSQLSLWGTTADLYLITLDALREDLSVEHLTPSQLQNALDAFVISIVSLRDGQTNRQSETRRLINRFVTDVSQNLLDFEVIFGVNNISFSTESFIVGDVEFRQFDSGFAADWCGDRMGELLTGVTRDALVNQAVGIVKVKAGTTLKARDRAAGKFDRALNVLRVGVGYGTSIMIYDTQLLQRRDQHCIIRQTGPDGGFVGRAFNQGFEATDIELSGTFAESTKNFIAEVAAIYDGTIQGRLREALVRSLIWVGTSITRELYDHKIVDLCTALESVLTTEDNQRKGEAVALRAMLLSTALGKPYRHPGVTHRLYDKRSRVVHGSALDECGESDYYTMRAIVEETILNILELIRTEASITRPSKLIEYLESTERLTEGLSWLLIWEDENSKEIAKYTEERLVKLLCA